MTQPTKLKTKMKPTTVNEYVSQQAAKFSALSKSRKSQLTAQSREFIAKNPGCADHSNFWRGLSARQVLATK